MEKMRLRDPDTLYDVDFSEVGKKDEDIMFVDRLGRLNRRVVRRREYELYRQRILKPIH